MSNIKGYTIPKHNRKYGLKILFASNYEMPYWISYATRFYNNEKDRDKAKKEFESKSNIFRYYHFIDFIFDKDKIEEYDLIYNTTIHFTEENPNPINKKIKDGFTNDEYKLIIERLYKSLKSADFFIEHNPKSDKFKHYYIRICDYYKFLPISLMRVKLNNCFDWITTSYKKSVNDYLKKLKEFECNL